MTTQEPSEKARALAFTIAKYLEKNNSIGWAMVAAEAHEVATQISSAVAEAVAQAESHARVTAQIAEADRIAWNAERERFMSERQALGMEVSDLRADLAAALRSRSPGAPTRQEG